MELSKIASDKITAFNEETKQLLAAEVQEDKRVLIVAEREEKRVALVEELEKAPATKEKFTRSTKQEEIDGIALEVSGTVKNGANSESYECEIELPYHKHILSFLQQSVMKKLKKQGRSADAVITTIIDMSTEKKIKATFFGKNILDLNMDELEQARVYYNLKGVKFNRGIQFAIKAAYLSFCKSTGRDAPDGDEYKRWAPIYLTK